MVFRIWPMLRPRPGIVRRSGVMGGCLGIGCGCVGIGDVGGYGSVLPDCGGIGIGDGGVGIG